MAKGRLRFLPRETKTATFSTRSYNVADADELRIQVETHAAATGTTPSMVVTVEDSIDGGVTWNVIDTFTAITTAVAVQTRNIASTVQFGSDVRCTGTITGTDTPTFDISIDGYAE